MLPFLGFPGVGAEPFQPGIAIVVQFSAWQRSFQKNRK